MRISDWSSDVCSSDLSPDFPSPEQRRSLPVGVTQGQGMEIRQKKNSNKIRFVFGEEALDYSIEDSSGSRSYSVPYTDISRDRQTLVERNQWLGNVGMLWLLLGAGLRSEEHTSELHSLMRISYAVFCLKNK